MLQLLITNNLLQNTHPQRSILVLYRYITYITHTLANHVPNTTLTKDPSKIIISYNSMNVIDVLPVTASMYRCAVFSMATLTIFWDSCGVPKRG